MTGTGFLRLTTILWVALGPGVALHAADDPAPPPGRPTREQIRESVRNLTPEERTARLKAIRDSGGLGAPAADALLKRRAEWEKLRKETEGLPPEQREAKRREWREKNAAGRPALARMTAEERAERRKLFQKRIEDHIATLNNKKAEGSFSEEESRRLQNMERMLKRLESAPGPGAPLGLPLPSTPADKPSKADKPAKPDEPARPGEPAKAK